LRRRASRDQDRRFLVEGAQGVREALAGDRAEIDELFTADPLHELALRARERGVTVHEVGPAAIGKIASTVTPQDVLGVAPFRDVDLTEIPPGGCVAVLHEVRDPGNAGTVVRSADAAGADAVVFTASSVDPYNPKAVRATAGSLFHLPIVRGADPAAALDALRSSGHRILAMAGDGGESLYAADLTGPIAFVFGNEAHGLPADVRRSADAVVRVPQSGRAESLNLAAAATVCLFEWARRRLGRGQVLDEMITAAAHDIRSPLTAMKGFTYTLERRWPELGDDERAAMLTAIAHDADRMDHVVRLLVDAARVASGALDLFPESTDVHACIAMVAAQRARDPDQPVLTWSGDPGPFLVDATRLRTAVLAFCEVLAWWGGEGAIAVRTTASAPEGGFALEARRRADRDVDAATIGALFLPRPPGTGGGSKIGPYVVRGVVETQGGRVWGALEDGDLVLRMVLPNAHRIPRDDAPAGGDPERGDR
jgi:TrmH family RNA methyltransferase